MLWIPLCRSAAWEKLLITAAGGSDEPLHRLQENPSDTTIVLSFIFPALDVSMLDMANTMIMESMVSAPLEFSRCEMILEVGVARFKDRESHVYSKQRFQSLKLCSDIALEMIRRDRQRENMPEWCGDIGTTTAVAWNRAGSGWTLTNYAAT